MLPSNSVTLPATPRWLELSTCSPASSKAVGSRASRVSSSPTPRSFEQLLVAAARLVLDVHVRVERDERAVLHLGERVDLGERHVVVDEQLRELADDRRETLQRVTGDARLRDALLRVEVRERQDVREVDAPDVIGVLARDLLDVDPAHVAEEDHRLLRDPVPDDARVVLLLDVGLRVDEHAARLLAVDLELEDVGGVGLGLLGRVGELHAAGLHPPAGQDLGLDDRRPADALRDRLGLGRIGREAEVRDRDARALDDLASFVFEETHLLLTCRRGLNSWSRTL